MKIKLRSSNFSQFSDDLWLEVEHNGVNMAVDVDHADLIDFAKMLLNTVDDALRKVNVETSDLERRVTELMDDLEATE